MSQRHPLALVAGAATLLAALPLTTVYATFTWLFYTAVAIAMITGTAMAVRSLRGPLWVQVSAMLAVLMLYLTWSFPSGAEFARLVPSASTFRHFGQLLNEASGHVQDEAVPVPDFDGLIMLTVAGVGLVAIMVDFLAVGLRRPALAGLPMLAIYSVPVAVMPTGLSFVPFGFAAAGYLWLLVTDSVDRVRRFGRRFTGDGRDVDVWEPSPLAAAGRRLAVIGVAVAVLLPVVVPGLTTGLLSRLTQVGGGSGTGGFGSGGNGRVNLFASLSGSLNQNETREMIKVTTNEAEPFYLRLGVADVVNEGGFANRPPTGRSIARGFSDPRQGPARPGVQYQQYRANVEILDLNMALAPIYPTPVSVSDIGNGWAYDAGAQVLFSNRNTTKDKNYTFDYVRARYNPQALRQAEPIAKTDPLAAQTTVPNDPVVDPLVAQLIRDKDTEYDKVRAIYDYFSRGRGFSYSLTTASGTSGSDIATFLETKTGFCQQYAAALAWMVRVAGIPARVAFGFTRGGDREGNTWTLTNRNAHAWTEVYFAGYGWVPFDATPAAGVIGAARSDWAPDTDRPAPVASSSSNAAVPGSDSSTAPAGADPRENRGFDDAGLAAVGGSTPASTTALWVAGGAALLMALLLVPALLRVMRRRRRHAATVPKAAAVAAAKPPAAGPSGDRDITVTTEVVRARVDAHAAWDELIDTMIDYRVPVDPTETPRITAQRLIRDAELDTGPAESVQLLGRAEERARYARRPLQGGELTEALGRVRKGMARTAPRWTRLAAVLMPPSVLLRWRLGLADASARWVEIFGRGRDLLVRWSPRRLLASRAR